MHGSKKQGLFFRFLKNHSISCETQETYIKMAFSFQHACNSYCRKIRCKCCFLILRYTKVSQPYNSNKVSLKYKLVPSWLQLLWSYSPKRCKWLLDCKQPPTKPPQDIQTSQSKEPRPSIVWLLHNFSAKRTHLDMADNTTATLPAHIQAWTPLLPWRLPLLKQEWKEMK